MGAGNKHAEREAILRRELFLQRQQCVQCVLCLYLLLSSQLDTRDVIDNFIAILQRRF